MTGDEISGLVDKVAEKLGVASEEVAGAVEVLAAEYQTAQLVVAGVCVGVFVLVFFLCALFRAGMRQSYKTARKNGEFKEDDKGCEVGLVVFSWAVTFLTAIPCIIIACQSLYAAMMPRVALLARLGLLQ